MSKIKVENGYNLFSPRYKSPFTYKDKEFFNVYHISGKIYNKPDDIKELKKKLKESRETNNVLKSSFDKLAEENYELQEKIKII